MTKRHVSLKHTIHDYDILSRLLSLAQLKLFDPAGLAIARGSSPALYYAAGILRHILHALRFPDMLQNWNSRRHFPASNKERREQWLIPASGAAAE
jgi:hypothetical protein